MNSIKTDLKKRVRTQLAHNSEPPTAHQQYAILMEYRWWAVGGSTVCPSWVIDIILISQPEQCCTCSKEPSQFDYSNCMFKLIEENTILSSKFA